ncbi:MAG: hypothetical protein U0670_03380 [Anaerolineae bacterium]
METYFSFKEKLTPTMKKLQPSQWAGIFMIAAGAIVLFANLSTAAGIVLVVLGIIFLVQQTVRGGSSSV